MFEILGMLVVAYRLFRFGRPGNAASGMELPVRKPWEGEPE